MQNTAEKTVDERKSWDWRVQAEWRFLKTMGVMVWMRETEVQREVSVNPSCQEGARVTSQPLSWPTGRPAGSRVPLTIGAQGSL